MNKNFASNAIYIATLLFLGLPTATHAQVAISFGAQTFYDDNVFLENGKDRPAPVTFNDQLFESFPSGYSSLKNFDGKKDSDFISNLYTQFSGKPPVLRQTLNSDYNLRVGTLLFKEFTEQDRITLDGSLNTALSNNILPDPFYVRVGNAIQSASNNLGVASGSVAQSSQNYLFSAGTGVNNVKITKDLSYNLGYTGTYQAFLGAIYLNNDSSNTNTKQAGTDYHSHSADTGVKYQIDKNLDVGAVASGGIQMFTKIHNGAFANSTEDPSDLDRTNAQIQGTTNYILTKSFTFNGSAGLGYSKLMKEPSPQTITVIDDNGQTQNITKNQDGSSTGLTYTGSLSYAYRPGGLLTLGSTQGFTTNLDGKRFVSRMVFANLVETLTNDLQMSLGTRYVQFEDEAKTQPDTGRFEGSASLNYHLTDSTSLNCGYNYSDQSSSSSLLSNTPGYATPDYTSNRLFVGITSGLVGLPF